MTDTLTPTELTELTGKRRAASQAAELARRGVPFTFVGSAVRLSRQVAEAFALVPQQQPSGLDFSKVR